MIDKIWSWYDSKPKKYRWIFWIFLAVLTVIIFILIILSKGVNIPMQLINLKRTRVDKKIADIDKRKALIDKEIKRIQEKRKLEDEEYKEICDTIDAAKSIDELAELLERRRKARRTKRNNT